MQITVEKYEAEQVFHIAVKQAGLANMYDTLSRGKPRYYCNALATPANRTIYYKSVDSMLRDIENRGFKIMEIVK